MLTLRPYQEAALAALAAAEARGRRRLLIGLPTGTGKTPSFAELIRRRANRRALVLVHRDELIRQAVEKLRQFAPHLRVGIVQGAQHEIHAPVVVASVQSLSRPTRLRTLAPDFGTVVIDEAHHAAADTYRRILEHVQAFEPSGPLVVGVTATPYRADGVSLVGEVFEELCYERGLLDMIREGYLSDLRAVQIHLAVDLNRLRTSHGDFVASEVEEVLRAANAPAHVADAIVAQAADRKGLIFTPSVALAHDMAQAVSARGIAAEAIDGDMPLDSRRAILARLASGETQFVANCGILTEGFDEPSVSCIVIARPTRSKTLYVQMIGRGTRKYPGKAECLILDAVGVADRHDLMTAGTLFGVAKHFLRGRTIVEAAATQEAERHVAEAAEALAGRLIANRIALFETRAFHWLTLNPQHFVLAVGPTGMLHVEERPTGWRVALVSPTGARQILRESVTLELAQGLAEDHVRQAGAAALVTQAADWRTAPASAKQLDLLRRMRLRPAPGLTRGEASDLIAKRIARRPNFSRKKIRTLP